MIKLKDESGKVVFIVSDESTPVFMCSCVGNGKGGHTPGCFDDPKNRCPDCGSSGALLENSNHKCKKEVK